MEAFMTHQLLNCLSVASESHNKRLFVMAPDVYDTVPALVSQLQVIWLRITVCMHRHCTQNWGITCSRLTWCNVHFAGAILVQSSLPSHEVQPQQAPAIR